MTQSRRLAIVGCGHVGAVTAACFAELGHAVVGVDIDPQSTDGLNRIVIPYIEPGLPEFFERNIAAGRLNFTTDHAAALEGAEFVFLCVNTPLTITGAADLRYVRKAVGQIAEVVSRTKARPVIVNRSTSPIGTEETIDAILSRSFARAATKPAIVANPEFTREGEAVHEFFNPDRIVIGAGRLEDAEAVSALYAGIDAPRILTDVRTAEMIKYVSNAFLATKVSFINDIARLCERLGVDVDPVAQGAALDPRIGGQYFKPGVGYGGSGLPKDVAALNHTGESVGLSMRLLSSVQDVNVSQRKHVVNSIREIVGPLEGLTIAALGVTFKSGSEDLRESPAVDIIGLLRNEGAFVRVYDPSLREDRAVSVADEVCKSALDAARDADCVAILTDWPVRDRGPRPPRRRDEGHVALRRPQSARTRPRRGRRAGLRRYRQAGQRQWTRTARVWLREMRVLVAGGAGFIGSHVCDELLSRGHQVICLDNLVTGNLRNIETLRANPAFSLVEADVITAPRVETDLVLHLASPASPVHYKDFPIETMLANSAGTHRLLEITKSNDARFVFASTSEVYGDPLGDPHARPTGATSIRSGRAPATTSRSASVRP